MRFNGLINLGKSCVASDLETDYDDDDNFHSGEDAEGNPNRNIIRGSQEEKKAKIKVWLNAISNLFDVGSDVLYIYTVPAYYIILKVLMIFFVLLPILLIS